MAGEILLTISLTPDEKKRVEDKARQLGYETPTEYVHALVLSDAVKRLSARDLLKMHPDEQRNILEKMAIEAENDYRYNPSLTDFEAFGEDDLYDETP